MRQHFKISRASEYFEESELIKRTGMIRQNWTEALLKELIDNALDIVEGTPGEIEIRLTNEQLSVWDNGAGMSCGLIKNILDFESRTSDKSAYQGPTRGQQGNAFKTFLGIAYNNGGHVEIESRNLKHEIRCEINPAGLIDVDHVVTDYHCTGTKITIHCIPELPWDTDQQWIFNYHLVNPFVQIRYFSGEDLATLHDQKPVILYKSGTLDKIKSTDPTSPHWYSAEKFLKLAYMSKETGVPLGTFIGSFQGLKTSRKKKIVAGGLDMATIANDPEQAQALLDRMKNESRPIKPNKLGLIGEDTLTEIQHPGRRWYRKCSGTHDGKPWAFEIFVAECDFTGCCTAVNHSITFEDFLFGYMKDGWLNADSFKDAVYGFSDHFLLAHYVGISPEFRSLGKDQIILPKEVLAAIANKTKCALDVLHTEKKKRDRDNTANERIWEEVSRPEKQTSLAEAIPLIIDEAIDKASESGQYDYSFRDLYYAARALVQKYTDKELSQPYFSKQCDEYWQGNRPAQCLYDPRGFLYEPHTHGETPLGTKDVSDYSMPKYLYNKILYVEKKGVLTAIKQAGLPEKFDMAIIATEGFATVAARTIMNMAQDRDFTIYVFHDADPAGYEIARTIEQETAAMPDNRIKIVDLGLDIQTCIDQDLLPEFFSRKKALPSKQNFSEIELEYFTGQSRWYWKNGKEKKVWRKCRRFEINALLPGDRVEYLDQKIGDHIGGYGKVIPPDDVQQEEAKEVFAGKLDSMAEEHFAPLVRELKARLNNRFSLPKDNSPDIQGYLSKHKYNRWKDGVYADVGEYLREINDKIQDELG